MKILYSRWDRELDPLLAAEKKGSPSNSVVIFSRSKMTGQDLRHPSSLTLDGTCHRSVSIHSRIRHGWCVGVEMQFSLCS